MRRPSTVRVVVAAAVAGIVLTAAAPSPQVSPSEGPFEQDDAGSGRDAGNDPDTAVMVPRDVELSATLRPEPDEGGLLYATGDEDWFGFDAQEGETIQVLVLSEEPSPLAPNCPAIHDEEGTEIASGVCSDSVTVQIPADGRYYASFGYFAVAPVDYAFMVMAGSATDFGTGYRDAPTDMEPDPEQPTVIVAVGDTGVNPYHEAYHRPLLTEHPCTWVEGFDDCSIPALELSIGEYDSYAEAYAADEAIWQSLQVDQWYWIPRTNIIGAVCDGSTNVSGTPPPVTPDTPCIHDEHGHGTGTTSAVLSEAPEALLLVHEGNSGASALEHAPVVPDIQSHSWGPAAPLPLHAADPVLRTLFDIGLADRGAYDEETIFFIAAGNEAPFPAALDSSRVHPAVQVVGGGFPDRATASSWSTFDYASWFCRPTAVPYSIDAVRPSYCGTSFSAPTVAGAAAAALLELRRAEGYTGRSTPDMVTPTVSRATFIDALRSAATYAVEPRYDNRRSSVGAEAPLPEGQEHVFWGYGWLDATRIDAVVTCASGGECPTKSPEAEQWNEARQEVRRRQTQGL